MKTQWDIVKEDMKTFGLSHEDAQIRNECGRKVKEAAG